MKSNNNDSGGDNQKPPYYENADPVQFFMHDCFYESDLTSDLLKKRKARMKALLEDGIKNGSFNTVGSVLRSQGTLVGLR